MSDLIQVYPKYTIAQVCSAVSFFELTDSHSPFLQTFSLPDPEDYKKDKFSVSLTTFSKDPAVKSKHLRTFIDKKELLLLCDQMSRGVKGQEVSPGVYKPILESKKGSPDKSHPEWEFTSRILTVTYTQLKSGVPGYIVTFNISEGKQLGQGLVAPTGNREGAESGMIALPIVTSDKGNPASGLQLAHQVSNYLQARETARLSLWGSSISRLKAKAEKGDSEAITEWNKFAESYN